MVATLPFIAPMPSSDPTVGELIRLYLSLEAKVETRRAVRSWRECERVLKHFRAAFGHLHISECRKGQLPIWIDRNPGLKSNWTRGRWCRTIQRLFNWGCEDMELIARNPFKGVRYPKGKRGRPLTDDEFSAVYKAADDDFRPVLEFCRLTGCRPGEMASATWDDLHSADGAAWISLAEHKTSDREDAKPRIIGLPSSIVAMLAQIRKARPVALFVPDQIFLNSRGEPWTRNAICLRFARLRKRCGLMADARLYGCRSAWCTAAIRAGESLKTVSDAMGHASTKMTEYYAATAQDYSRFAELTERVAKGLTHEPPP